MSSGKIADPDKTEVLDLSSNDGTEGIETESSVTNLTEVENTVTDDTENKKIEPEGNNKKETKKPSIIDRLGSVSDKTISIIASIAVGAMILWPAGMAVYDMIQQNIDLSVLVSWNVVRIGVFPFVSVVAFVLYILVLMRINKEKIRIFDVLKKNPLFLVFSLAVILIFISQFYNGMESGVDDVLDFLVGESFDMQYSYFIFVLFAATQVRLNSHKRFLLRTHILVTILLVIAGFVLWHTQTESWLFIKWTERFSSIFSNTNYYGYYLAIAVPFSAAAFLDEKKAVWKIVSFFALVLNTVALSLDDSLGAWMGAGAAMFFVAVSHFLIKKKISWQPFALIVVFAICIYIPGHIEGTFDETMSILGDDIVNIAEGKEEAIHAGTDRMNIWAAHLKIINKNKLLGIGFEGVYTRRIVEAVNTRSHNEFMQYAVFYGIPMAVLYFIGCLGIYIRALKKKKTLTGATWICLCGAFGYLVNSLVGITMYCSAMYLFIFLGMGYVRHEAGYAKHSDKSKKEHRTVEDIQA